MLTAKPVLIVEGNIYRALDLAAAAEELNGRVLGPVGSALIATRTGFPLIWRNFAVGYVGDRDSRSTWSSSRSRSLRLSAERWPGSAVRRSRWSCWPPGIAHAAATAIGCPEDTRTGVTSLVFAALWLTSALVFRRATRGQ